MATYLIINLFFALGEIPALVRYRRFVTRHNVMRYAVILAVLFVLTAVFDNVIVGLGIVGYERSKILGLYVGRAPIEDFFYPLVAAFIVPVAWAGGKVRE